MSQDRRPRGIIEVDMFGKEVDSFSHPEVEQFRLLLEQVADDFDSRLLSFEIKRGTVSFSFDREELTAEILKIFQEKNATNQP